jgi:hypothetical protein
MIQVTGIGTDTCDYSGRETEGYYVIYEDGTSGFLSKKELWNQLSFKQRKKDNEEAEQTGKSSSL